MCFDNVRSVIIKSSDMSKNYTSSHEIQETASSSSSKVSSSSTSYKYNTIGRTTNISNSYNTVNKDYKSISSMVNHVQDRQAFNKSITNPVKTSHTPEYQSRPRSNPAPIAGYTSINRLSPFQTANMTNAVASSVPKQTTILEANKNRGLFYSFDNNLKTPKQSIAVPQMYTAAEFSTQPIPPPSLLVDRPNKKNFFTKLISSNRKQGYALILNHYKFQKGYRATREGTQPDVDMLKTVFDEYNIVTDVKLDLQLNEINREVKNLSNKDFTQYKCFIIVILTHGEPNEILSASDETYNFIDHIEDPLLIGNKTLVDKPKIFIIQACRGHVEMPVIQRDSVKAEPARRQSSVAKRNIFKCNATYEGYVSFRHITKGTIFIQALCKKLREIGRTETIYNIMMKVIDEVSNDPEIPQVPTVLSSMTNSFCFGSLLN